MSQILAFPRVGGSRDAIELTKNRRRSFAAGEPRRRIEVLPLLKKVRERLEAYRLDLPTDGGKLAASRLLEESPRYPLHPAVGPGGAPRHSRERATDELSGGCPHIQLLFHAFCG